MIVEMDENSHMAVVSWQMRKNISCEHGLQEMVYWCTVDKNQGNQTYALCQVGIFSYINHIHFCAYGLF